MIFECGQNGADGKVYPYLASQLRSDLEIQPFFLDSKPRLIQECGVATKQLLEIDKCEGVLIIWDLRPPWQVKKQNKRLCPVEDCERIRHALENKLTTQQSQKFRRHIDCCVVRPLTSEHVA